MYVVWFFKGLKSPKKSSCFNTRGSPVALFVPKIKPEIQKSILLLPACSSSPLQFCQLCHRILYFHPKSLECQNKYWVRCLPYYTAIIQPKGIKRYQVPGETYRDKGGEILKCSENRERSKDALQRFSCIGIALFDMPNSNRFNILSILIFSKISLSISISIFSKIS